MRAHSLQTVNAQLTVVVDSSGVACMGGGFLADDTTEPSGSAQSGNSPAEWAVEVVSPLLIRVQRYVRDSGVLPAPLGALKIGNHGGSGLGYTKRPKQDGQK